MNVMVSVDGQYYATFEHRCYCVKPVVTCEGVRWCTEVYGAVRTVVYGGVRWCTYLVPMSCPQHYCSNTLLMCRQLSILPFPCFQQTEPIRTPTHQPSIGGMLPQHLHALRPVIMRCKVVYGFELLPEDGGVAVYGGGWWMVVCHCGGAWWWLGVVREPCSQ
jgi:hypothetical protein